MRLDSSSSVGIAVFLAIAIACRVPAAGAQRAGSAPAACSSAAASGRGAGSADSTSASRDARAPLVSDTGRAALRILAAVSAEEVRFVGSPQLCVQLTGDVHLDGVHVLARRNIASPVVSGTTYRNVYVAAEIVGRLNAECISARVLRTASGSAPPAACASVDAPTVTPPPGSSPP